MTRKRLSGNDRRASILDAATTVFAQQGFEGAKTQQIAAAAKVSEALVFRHFPSKMALYRAVLRKLMNEQRENFARIGLIAPSTDGLVSMLRSYFEYSLEGSRAHNAERMKIFFASLAGDGRYARILYRRSRRIVRKPLEAALKAARESGDLTGPEISPDNIMAFIEHVGSMMLVARLPKTPTVQYGGDDEQVLQQAIWFCGRGIGLKEEAIASRLEPAKKAPQRRSTRASASAADAAKPAPKAAKPTPKPAKPAAKTAKPEVKAAKPRAKVAR